MNTITWIKLNHLNYTDDLFYVKDSTEPSLISNKYELKTIPSDFTFVAIKYNCLYDQQFFELLDRYTAIEDCNYNCVPGITYYRSPELAFLINKTYPPVKKYYAEYLSASYRKGWRLYQYNYDGLPAYAIELPCLIESYTRIDYDDELQTNGKWNIKFLFMYKGEEFSNNVKLDNYVFYVTKRELMTKGIQKK